MKTLRLAASIVVVGIAVFAASASPGAQAQQRAAYVSALDKSGAPVAELTRS